MMEKIHKQVAREGGAAAGKAESKIKEAITKPIKPNKGVTSSGGRKPGDKK
jgi:hypothetical protein